MENAKYYEKIGCCWILNQNEMNQIEIDNLLLKSSKMKMITIQKIN